jgi:hypothetical protein
MSIGRVYGHGEPFALRRAIDGISRVKVEQGEMVEIIVSQEITGMPVFQECRR